MGKFGTLGYGGATDTTNSAYSAYAEAARQRQEEEAKKRRRQEALREALLAFSRQMAGADPRLGWKAALAGGVGAGAGAFSETHSSFAAREAAAREAEEKRLRDEAERAEDDAWEGTVRERTRRGWTDEDREREAERAAAKAQREAREAYISGLEPEKREQLRLWINGSDTDWARAVEKYNGPAESDEVQYRSGNSPIVRLNPRTGQTEVIYTPPPKPGREREDRGPTRAQQETAATRAAKQTYDEAVSEWEENGRTRGERRPVWANHWNREAEQRGLPLLPGGDSFWYESRPNPSGGPRLRGVAPPPDDDGPPPGQPARPTAGANTRGSAPPPAVGEMNPANPAYRLESDPGYTPSLRATAKAKGFNVEMARRDGLTWAQIREALGL